jgi:hypothetical protein
MMQSEESSFGSNEGGGAITMSARPKNWPPWPKSFIHHDIDGEILEPTHHRYTTLSYYGWFGMAPLLSVRVGLFSLDAGVLLDRCVALSLLVRSAQYSVVVSDTQVHLVHIVLSSNMEWLPPLLL